MISPSSSAAETPREEGDGSPREAGGGRGRSSVSPDSSADGSPREAGGGRGRSSVSPDSSADGSREAGGGRGRSSVSPDSSADGSREAGGGRGRLVLAGLTVALAAVIGVSVVASRGDSPPPRPDIPLDAWAPYWTLDDSLPELRRRIGSMRELSPFWFNVAAADSIVVDPNARQDAIDDFMSIARRSRVAVVPSIVDALPAGEMAAILADPETRELHVRTLTEFADDGGYDGLDLDYEQFAFSDGRASWAATRPNWVEFVRELSAALHADGRTLTVSIPPVLDAGRGPNSGFWVYDYAAIAPLVDRIRIMAYDFSVGEPGPIAPLDWVESAIVGAIEATGAPDKLVLGVPAYGRNWPTTTEGVCPATDTPGRTSVTARSVDELIERRGATPSFVDETGEWTFGYELEVADDVTSCVQTRVVNYVDGDGVRLRMDLARRYHLDGVSLWALGFDDDAVWDEILATVADPTTTEAPDGDS